VLTDLLGGRLTDVQYALDDQYHTVRDAIDSDASITPSGTPPWAMGM
jgi:hypothetical protein